MRIARKLALLATMAVTALAMTAGSASAVEVVAETGAGTGVHCSALSLTDHAYSQSNTCLLAIIGRAVELTDPIGIMHVCDNTFDARVNERGEGFIYNQRLTGATCDVRPVFEADGHAEPWPAEITAERVGGVAGVHSMEAVFSVTGAFGIIAKCHLNGLQITQTRHTLGSIATTPAGTHVRCENGSAVNGTWTVTSPPRGIEIS